MLTAFRIKNEKYYTALARADYYEEGGESLGEWHGKGASALGLSGQVKTAQLSRLLDGYCPHGSGKKLLQNAGTRSALYHKDGAVKERTREVGFDATFSAPKSVSVAWAMADQRTRNVIQACHHQAVKKTLDILENNYAHSRCGRGGKRLEKTRIATALFFHGTSRYVEGVAPDPQLHTHCLVAKASARENGATGGLLFSAYPRHQGREGLLQVQKLLGAAYRLELSHRLQQRLGYEIMKTTGRGGEESYFELVGVDPNVSQAFSKRRQQIEHELEKTEQTVDESPVLKSAVLALKTRGVKGVIPPRKQLFEQWQQLGRQLGYQSPPSTFQLPARQKSLQQLQTSMEQFMQKRESFSRTELLELAAKQAVGTGMNYEDVGERVDKRLTQEDVVARSRSPGAQHYALRQSLVAEEQFAEQLAQSNCHLSPSSEEEAAKWGGAQVAENPEQTPLTLPALEEENSGEIYLINAGNKQQRWEAIKTAHEQWQQRGKEVLGIVPGTQAYQFEQKAGVKSYPPDWFAFTYGEGNQRLNQHHVLLIHRVEQMGSQRLSTLLKMAQKTGASVVMMGSRRFMRFLSSAVIREHQRHERELVISLVAAQEGIDRQNETAL